MDPQMWQQLQQQQGRGAAVPPASVPVGDVPMKGVILANRKMIFHKTRVCPRLSSGACHLGSKCNFAHSVEELRPPPNLDKTKLCPSVLQPGTVCPAEARGEICRFAHSKVEIRHTSNMFKTNMCLKWIRGKCKKDLQCNHAHGHQELKYYRSLAMASGSRDFARESEATLPRRKKQVSAAPAAPSLAGLAEILYSSRQQQHSGSSRDWGSTYTTHAAAQEGSSREALLQLLSRSCGAKQQQRVGTQVFQDSLAALYDGLVGPKPVGEAAAAHGGCVALGASLQDDSTTAPDECSDFSSFSSRTISDALRSAASCDTLHPAQLGRPRPALATGGGPVLQSAAENTSGAEGPLAVDRLVLLRMLAEVGMLASRSPGTADIQPELLLSDAAGAAAPAAAANGGGVVGGTSEGEGKHLSPSLELLENSLSRLCVADQGTLRRHCYTDPPPGFESRPLQHHQHRALLDLDRLAASGDLS